jgi:DNA repair protein RecN (Recombination protein N)
MLGIKSIFARSKDLPSIIFDEIDTGVSGSVADKMGKIMNDMASSMQVITITHLPQLASKGASHFFVYKEDDANHTYTRMRKLTSDERVVEIAKMLSSGSPSVKAMENAKELLTEN